MFPRYILSDNGMEFKNNLMDQVLQQLGIDRIFSAPYHLQSNGKLEVFHKYLKQTLKKLCEKDPANWDKYINQVLTSYRITPNLATTESPFFLVYGRDPNLPLHQLLEPMQHFLGDPDSGKLHMETHKLALAITKKPWMKIDLLPPKRLFQEITQPFKLEIMSTSRTNNPENGILSGDPDIR